MGFLLKSSATKKAAKKAAERGAKYSNFSMGDKASAKLLILGPTKEDHAAVFTTSVHEVWANGKPVAKCGSPQFTGDDDKIAKIGWKLHKKFKENKNPKLKEAYKMFLPKQNNHIVVLDMDDVEAGPQIFPMTGAVSEVVLDEINDAENDDLSDICDLNEGRLLFVKSNKKPKLKRRYKAKFLTQTANLLEDGILDEESAEELAKNVPDLTKLQPAFDEKAYEKVLNLLTQRMAKLGVDVEALGDSESNDESDDETELEEGEELDENELDFEEDEAPKKTSKKVVKKNKPKDDDFEEELEEEELEEEFEEEEEVEEKPKKKVAKKVEPAKKKVVKKAAVEEEEFEDFEEEELEDFEEFEEEEEVEEKPKKKAARRR